jgi:hypothetical protein
LWRGDGSSFAGVFECLAWAGAIDDRLKGTQPIPPVVRGLWYVRNLVLHQGADVVATIATYGSAVYGEATYGVSFGGARPLSSSTVFPPRNELPPPQSLKGAPEYDTLVASQPVAEVLQRAVTELIGAQSGAQGG